MKFGQTTTTPFFLHEDKTPGKYRIPEELKQSIDNKNMIPFLRTNDEDYYKVLAKGRRNYRAHSMNQSFAKQVKGSP
jgi:hypothetical protein